MYYIGVDVGGTSLKAGLVNEAGEIVARASCPTEPDKGVEHVVSRMAEVAMKAAEAGSVPLADVHSIGLGIPGIEDPATRIVPICANLYWRDVPLAKMLTEKLNRPVYIGNDATVAGYAEYVAGISKGTDSSVFITLGTGVGGGIVINGKPWSGFHGVGSEIGHMMVEAGDGIVCTCENRGCWERYASATALIRMGRVRAEKNPGSALMQAVNGDADQITAKHVMDLAKEGDPDCAAAFEEYIYFLAAGIVNLINVLDPEMIILGGGVSHAGAFLLDAVRSKVDEMAFCKALPHAKIELARLGNDAGIIGAAMLGR